MQGEEEMMKRGIVRERFRKRVFTFLGGTPNEFVKHAQDQFNTMQEQHLKTIRELYKIGSKCESDKRKIEKKLASCKEELQELASDYKELEGRYKELDYRLKQAFKHGGNIDE